MSHSERFKDPFLREFSEGHSADARNQNGSKVVTGVAVRVARTGRKVQSRLYADDLEHMRVRVDTRRSRPACNAGNTSPIAQSTGMRQYVANRQGGAVVG